MGYPRVHLNEEVMREGMQIESVEISVEAKSELLQRLTECNFEAINVGSFVSPRYTPQMANLEEVLERFVPVPGTDYYCLVMNQKGIERASRFPWLRPASRPITGVHLCDTFVRRNMNRSRDDEIAGWEGTVQRAKQANVTEGGVMLGAAWGSNFEGPFTLDDRLDMLRRQNSVWEAAGIPVTSAIFADPMSWCMPHWVKETLDAVRSEWPQITKFTQHLHDGRGMALPSIYATLEALDENCEVWFDVTAGGIGGCPYCGNGRATGMAATEDVVSMLRAMQIDCHIDLDKLIDFVARLDEVIGRPSPGHTSKAGPLPFRSEDFYDPNLPLVETHAEAEHFRLGAEVTEHQLRPWRTSIPVPALRVSRA